MVYRVAQEALTNAARHAQAEHVQLSLTRLGDRVVLEVADDGRGFGDLVRGRRDARACASGHCLVGGDLDDHQLRARRHRGPAGRPGAGSDRDSTASCWPTTTRWSAAAFA